MKELTHCSRQMYYMLLSKYKAFSSKHKLAYDGSFYYDDGRLAKELYMSLKTIRRARKALVRYGYIKAESGRHKGRATKYWIIPKVDKMSTFGEDKIDTLSSKVVNLSLKAGQNVIPNKINKDINKSEEIDFDLEKDDQETPEMTDDVVNAIKGFAQLMGKDFAYNSYVDKGFDSEEVKKALDC